MSKNRKYKTTCVGEYKIAIDICDKDVPCVIVGKHLEKDVIKNIFGYYSKDVVDFFLTIIDKLNKQAERIVELEEQLKNAIVPKFKIGQEVYKVYTANQKYPFVFKIIGFKITKSRGKENIFYNVEEDGFDMGWYPDEILFATKEEAQEKLKELQGE